MIIDYITIVTAAIDIDTDTLASHWLFIGHYFIIITPFSLITPLNITLIDIDTLLH